MHRWLIEPISPWLKQNHINTLVLVPDGVLRLIPPAALHDGQHYLIESYAVSVSQGLSLSLAPSLQSHEF
ncbi:CHAT domain-containing protein [Methylocucumis oryzae]|uniref:CHAT domain-containing protein n=1 Tax=Methylocucumis oryzae TaxID=1632867 RepID=A0A0F3IKJ9_9GAMM|nr:CHAT domain-containing protein [Methylocucumis oryzae]KJV06084.1 hypothetical protein VZ94_13555 [Methylocucumis oryzae]